jgi:hypothetical protein
VLQDWFSRAPAFPATHNLAFVSTLLDRLPDALFLAGLGLFAKMWLNRF